MRILTWNVNGIKTLPEFHPWNKYRSDAYPFEGILDALKADILCFQETKARRASQEQFHSLTKRPQITREKIDRSLALLPNYDGFFSSYRRTPPKGYSGTVTYCRRAAVVPRKAEEGLTGLLQQETNEPEPIGSYPALSELDYSMAELRDLDLEGRATVLDLGLFVLFNLYCPNQTNEARLEYKNAFNATLQARIEALIRDGREVMVVGDLNICAHEIDHCEPEKRAKDHGLASFADHPARKWLNKLCDPHRGALIDVCRYYHPVRRGMYTCWETKISARDTNFGTRLDYVLVTPGLMPWVEFSDIQADIKGSDHCPVYVDLKDEVTNEKGETLKLWDLMNPPERVALDQAGRDAYPPPRSAARNYDTFAHKLLSSFFSRKTASPAIDPNPSPPEASLDAALAALHEQSPPLMPIASGSRSPSVPSQAVVKPTKAPKAEPLTRKTSGTSKPKNGAKSPQEQKTIASFFAKPKAVSPPPRKVKVPVKVVAPKARPKSESPPVDLDLDDAGYEDMDDAEANEAVVKNAHAWEAMFKKPDAPLCKGHNEPCKEWEVKKSGPNKGRKFWLCARPTGEGYERRGMKKEDVNQQYRCDHFAWQTSVKRPSTATEMGQSKKSKTE